MVGLNGLGGELVRGGKSAFFFCLFVLFLPPFVLATKIGATQGDYDGDEVEKEADRSKANDRVRKGDRRKLQNERSSPFRLLL